MQQAAMSLVLNPEANADASVLTLDLLARRFGAMPPQRIRNSPAPGTATEADAIAINERKETLCELVDGVLLEKTMGWLESYLALEIAHLLKLFVEPSDLGLVLGPDGMLRLRAGRIRLPDACFISWDRLSGKLDARSATIDVAPDLAVEVVSPGNTRQELEEKLSDYFRAGVRLVWYVYPKQQQVHVFRAVDDRTVFGVADTLDGGDVLPGFSFDLARLFAEPKPRGN